MTNEPVASPLVVCAMFSAMELGSGGGSQDPWALAAAAAAASGGSRQRGAKRPALNPKLSEKKEKDKDEGDILLQKEPIMAIAKLPLSSALQARVLKSASLQVVIVEMEADPTKLMILAGKQFAE